MDIEKYIQLFFNEVANNKIQIYNEFSLQHELGVFLRKMLPKPLKVEFERNIRYFYHDAICIKSEIDIVIYSDDMKEKYAIELKFPRNGRRPESMFDYIKDIKFMEQLKGKGFTNSFVVMYVEDRLFYTGSKVDGIYAYFRNSKLLHGEIKKPTGEKNETIQIFGSYQIDWLSLENGGKYCVTKILDNY